MSLSHLAISLWVTCAAGGVAAAQSINLDFGDQKGVPPPAYGGAAHQPGVWNVVSGNETGPFPLVDIAGAPTSVQILLDLPFGQASYDDSAVVGEDAPLMNDYLDLHDVPSTIEIQGLQPGSYLVYAYAWAPDDPSFYTALTIDDDQRFKLGGIWPGRQVERVTYARAHVTIAAGEPLELFTFGILAGTLNGVQIKLLSPQVQPVH